MCRAKKSEIRIRLKPERKEFLLYPPTHKKKANYKKKTATRLELASKKGGFVKLLLRFSFSLHSNVDISVKWIYRYCHESGLILKLIKGTTTPVNMRSIAFQMGAGCVLEWRMARVHVVEGGGGGEVVHTNSMGKITFRKLKLHNFPNLGATIRYRLDFCFILQLINRAIIIKHNNI